MMNKISELYKKNRYFKLTSIGFLIFVLVSLVVLLVDQVCMPIYVGQEANVEVPDVSNLPLEKASEKLESLGLKPQIAGTSSYNSTVPKGHVISQLPYKGAVVKPGRNIYLAISRGIEMVQMPSVLGTTLMDARISLRRLGLDLPQESITYIENDSIAPNVVVYQSIPAGSNVTYGSKVSLAISSGGGTSIVPFVTDIDIEEAKQLLQSSGFLIGSVTFEENGTFMNGTVLRQVPRGGDSAKKGSQIELVVSRK